MDKEALKNMVLEILSSENEEVFSEFLKSVAEHLQGGKTLKLNGIGHFQLKKEPLSRMERRRGGSVSAKDILIFLPENEILEEKLLSFNVDNDKLNNNDFTNSVFDIGVNRETIISDSAGDGADNESKILELIESGNILEDFDILNNSNIVIPESESSNITSEQNNIKAAITIDDNREDWMEDEIDKKNDDSLLKDNVTEVQINKNFLNDSEEEILEKQLGDKDMELDEEKTNDEQNNNDYEEISSNIEDRNNKEDDIESETTTPVKEEDSDKIDDEKNSDNDADKNPFDELDDFIKEGTKEITYEEHDEASDELSHKASTDDGNVSEQESKTETNNSSYSELRSKSNQWYQNPLLAIVLVAVIGSLAIFYFWPSITGSVKSEGEGTMLQNSDRGLVDSVEANDTSKQNIVEKAMDEQITKTKQTDVTKKVDINKVKSVKTESSLISNSDLYRDIPNDRAVAQRIYFDGKIYTVQSSSWKNTTIAEKEVNKLKNRGFDAFIFKIFIKSKGDTWNRVRIGYFNSKAEAEEFLKKNKI